MKLALSVKSRHANRRFGGRAPAWASNVRLGSEILCRAVLLTFAVALAASPGSAADWPQPGCNPQHTGFSPDSPAPPYKAAWIADFRPELIHSAQPVIAGGRVYQTTLNGNLYALDAETGVRLWYFSAGECMWGSAAAGTAEHGGQGLVFAASWNGVLFALDAASGLEVWRYDTGEPVSGSPCIAENTVFIGTRKGKLFAVSMDGRVKWQSQLSWHLFTTPAYNDGKVFAVTEDMRAHCLDAATGTKIWMSEKFYGMVMREFWPVVHKGKLLFSVTPAVYRQKTELPVPFIMPWDIPKDKFEAMMAKYSKPVPGPNAGYDGRRISLLFGQPMPEEIEEAQQAVINLYEREPYYQTFYVLDEQTGRQLYHAVHYYAAAGLENLVTPAAVCADGTVVMTAIFGGSRLFRLDLDRNRWVDFFLELPSMPTDNCQYTSVGGKRIFSKNLFSCGPSAADAVVNYETHEVADIPFARIMTERKNGVSHKPAAWRPDGALAEGRLGSPLAGCPWGMAGGSPPAISGNRFFWIKHTQQLVAYEGRAEP